MAKPNQLLRITTATLRLRLRLRLRPETKNHFNYSNYSTTTTTPSFPATPSILLGLLLGLGSAATIYGSETKRNSSDPLDGLLPHNLSRETAHITRKSDADLLRSYLTIALCQIPGMATYGPILLNALSNSLPHVPLVGPLAWNGIQWIIRNTFFAHYVGGTTIEECQSVIESLHDRNLGALLNYSVEAADTPGGGDDGSKGCHINQDSIQKISEAVETMARWSASSASGPPQAGRRPMAVALKISGLINDPYLLQRASDYLVSNQLSPFIADGDLFPAGSDSPHPPLLSQTDRLALHHLVTGLRRICQNAKDAQILVMIDAEYSWFQPALDRIATFLSAEFNKVPGLEASSGWRMNAPTVFNTFQALLRLTPRRVEALLEDAEERGYSVGIKLVRGAYLVSETAHWAQQRASTEVALPVWASKRETDACFDQLAARLVSRLAHAVRRPADPPIGQLSLMIAGHNAHSARLVLEQLRDHEGLAWTGTDARRERLEMAAGLRGRLMFAQLYGMADDLSSALARILLPAHPAPPLVFKYLPFGPLAQVLPYLARRAQENQALLQSPDSSSGLALDRRLLGKEIRARVARWLASFS